jgi:glycosyltransferase involved in cell wall biosynthesis
MKIFLDCSLLSIGGGIQVGLSIIQNIVNDPSIETVVVCTPQIDAQLDQTIKQKLKAYHVVPNVSFYKKRQQGDYLCQLEAQYQPDLVFTVFGPSYWRSKAKNVQGFALGKMLYPEIRKFYPSQLSRFKESIFDWVKQKFFFKNVDNFLVETEVVKARLVDRFNISPQNIYVISNTYSPAFEQRLQERKKHIFADQSTITLFVPASFYVHKNLLILPKVLAELKKLNDKKVILKFTVPVNSPGWQEISRVAAEYGVLEQITTVGHVPNHLICDEYLASNFVLCPSLVESSTAVFPESFIAERPLLVSDRDFARNLCEDAAVYFDPLDAIDIARKIDVVMNDQQLQNKLLSSAVRVLHKNYLSPTEKWEQQRILLKKLANSQ